MPQVPFLNLGLNAVSSCEALAVLLLCSQLGNDIAIKSALLRSLT